MWRDIPAQIIISRGRKKSKKILSEKFLKKQAKAKKEKTPKKLDKDILTKRIKGLERLLKINQKDTKLDKR